MIQLILTILIFAQTTTQLGELKFTRPRDLTFQVENKSFMTLSSKGDLFFHKENFPNYNPDDFAKKFVKALKPYILGIKCQDEPPRR